MKKGFEYQKYAGMQELLRYHQQHPWLIWAILVLLYPLQDNPAPGLPELACNTVKCLNEALVQFSSSSEILT